MDEKITITKADCRFVMQDWLDQKGEECSTLDDLDACVDYLFTSLQKLTTDSQPQGTHCEATS